MKLSVVICSKYGDTQRIEASLRRQIYRPYEVLVETGNHLTKQRNNAVKKAKGDYILFLDDDLTLDRYYLNHMIYTICYYKPDAITGRVRVGIYKPNFLYHLYSRIFMLSPQGDGKFLPSGFPEGYKKSIVMYSEVLHGCNMAVKKEVFERVSFREDMEGGMYGEDDWFSWDMKQAGFKVIYNPWAICYDDREYPKNKQRWSTRCRIINLIKRYKERKKNWAGKLAFHWAMTGFILLKLIESLVMKDKSITKGVYDAFLFVLDGRE